MKNVIKSSVIAALLTMSAQAYALSVTYNFDYLAQARTTSTLSAGASLASLGLNNAGTIKFTDLASGSGVKVEIALTNLSQFSSGTGNMYANSIEFSFPGTGSGSGNIEYVTTGNSYKNISNNYSLTTGGDGGIEWDEHGSVGNGTAGDASSHKWAYFQQQINFTGGVSGSLANTTTGVVVTSPSFTAGETVVFELLNGETLSGGVNAGNPYAGFSVANLLAVKNQDTIQPDAFAWLRVRSFDGGIGIGEAKAGTFGYYAASSLSSQTGYTTQTLNFMATQVAAVPEAETYAMMMAGLALIGTIVRRRKSA